MNFSKESYVRISIISLSIVLIINIILYNIVEGESMMMFGLMSSWFLVFSLSVLTIIFGIHFIYIKIKEKIVRKSNNFFEANKLQNLSEEDIREDSLMKNKRIRSDNRK